MGIKGQDPHPSGPKRRIPFSRTTLQWLFLALGLLLGLELMGYGALMLLDHLKEPNIHPRTQQPLEVIHPYLGYVYNPSNNSEALTKHHGLAINSFGFLDDGPSLRKKSQNEIVVAVFGGSVAYFLSLNKVRPLSF